MNFYNEGRTEPSSTTLFERFRSSLYHYLALWYKTCLEFRRFFIIFGILLPLAVLGYLRAYSNAYHSTFPAAQTYAQKITPENGSVELPKVVITPKKVAFLFLMTKSLPLAPLWAKFFKHHDGLFSIYINAKPDHELILLEPFSRAKILTHETSWGGFNLVEAELKLLSTAFKDNDNERFLLLSDSCFPLYNFTYMYNYLMNSLTSYVSIISNPLRVNMERYNHVLSPEVTRAKWAKGGQWFEMSRAVAWRVISDKCYFPKFKRYCPSGQAPLCLPSEHYVQTLLKNTMHNSLANRSVTWTSWAKLRSVHPISYDFVDPKMIRTIRSHKCIWNGHHGYPCFLIARKFTKKALPSLLKHSRTLGY